MRCSMHSQRMVWQLLSAMCRVYAQHLTGVLQASCTLHRQLRMCAWDVSSFQLC